MKKLTTPVITLTLALALTACAKTGAPPDPQTPPPTTPPPTDTTSSATSTATSDTEEIGEGIYIDYFGEKIDISGYKQDNDMYYGSYEDYTYARKPTGFGFNSIDNPGFYDPETMELKVDYPETNPIEKIKIGDKFGTLTVTKTQFYFQRGRNANDNTIWQECASFVEYEGDITLKGYVFTATASEGYDTKGDIFFIPDSNLVKDIPFPVYAYNNKPCFYQINDSDLVIYTDSPYMTLGSLLDEAYARIDLSAIPDDGTAKYIEIALTGLHLIANDQTGSRYDAKIVKCN